MNPIEISEDLGGVAGRLRYSICSLVTKRDDYESMVASFIAGGFTYADCEYLYLDNCKQNDVDAFAGYNAFLLRARGKYVILCHQDVALLTDNRERLDHLLEQLHQHDVSWGVCGNAGADFSGSNVIRITDPHGSNTAVGGPFPTRVMSLDENFIVARRDANLALSRDMEGFHWYGSDICIIADILGYGSYVIDFHLLHHSAGKTSLEFHRAQQALDWKYRRAFRSRRQFTVTGYSFVVMPSKMQVVAGFLQKAIKRVRRFAALR
jgi:hypothetical protein